MLVKSIIFGYHFIVFSGYLIKDIAKNGQRLELFSLLPLVYVDESDTSAALRKTFCYNESLKVLQNKMDLKLLRQVFPTQTL